MAGSLLVSTRKGLFTLRRGPSGWAVTGTSFLGVPVTLTLTDRRTGTVYAAVEHGHFGPKLHASTDGVTWSELVSPAFSAVDGEAGPSVSTIWALEAGPRRVRASCGAARSPVACSAATTVGRAGC